jgi:hypothetical protein
MDKQIWLGWVLLVAGVLLLVLVNRLEFVSILLPFSLLVTCGAMALTGKKSDVSAGLKKR